MDIAGQRILITGAAGGLGRATAVELARRGADIVLSGRNEVALKELATQVDGEVVIADLADTADVERLLGLMAGIDVLVANAGIGSDAQLDLTAADIDGSIDVNLRAPIHLATEFARTHIAAGRPGHVVLVGSLSGVAASPATSMYNATKFGLRGFALSFRQDLHDTCVGLSLVEPGFISEAGMFVNSGIDLPKGVRTKRPADVAAGVAGAIEGDLGEVFVAPVELTLASKLGGLAPGLSATIQRRVGVAERKA